MIILPPFLSVLVLIFGFRALIRHRARRHWKGETQRHFERDWEVRFRKNSFYFAVPSFKTSYFEVSTPSLWTRWRLKLSRTPLAREFHFISEMPALGDQFLKDPRFVETFRELQKDFHFILVSSGEELRGVLCHRNRKTKLESESPELQKALDLLGRVIDAQFTIYLTEMSPRHLKWWHRLRALPVAMAAAGVTAYVLVLLLGAWMDQESVIEAPKKVVTGLTFLSTGLALMAAAWSAPAHTFSRLAARLILLYSWAAYVWLTSFLTTLRTLL